MYRSVFNENITLLHHLLYVAQAQRIGHTPTHARHHHFERIVKPFEDLAQGVAD